MRDALQTLPWVRKVEVKYAEGLAFVTVESKSLEPKKLIAALEGAGFGGEVIQDSEAKAKAKSTP